mmetsp:Transcript_28227/g.84980  ORF Transcript_28227/g.84980 Transcript_28227/m.84980 type:complete len:289 (-) Transcript_28227:3672-4538(-)
MPEYIEKPGGDARAAKVFATECFCFGKNLAVEDFKVWLRAGGEGAEKAKKSYSMQAQGVYMIERMLAAMMSKEHVTPLEAGNMWAELRDCQEHVKALKAALDEFASAPDDPADDAETVVPPPEAAAGSASRVAKRKSLKEMKETIKTAGYGTADIFERPEIEQRYAEALDRLAEAEWMDTAGREAGAEVGAAGAGAAPKSASFQTAATLNPADVKQASDRATKDQAATARTLRKLERRRCVQCGALAPVTSPALPCCDGCGGPRYCDESCQRAHWLAGHQFECADATQ